jgi:NADH-quinone oxidoreductase subunit M
VPGLQFVERIEIFSWLPYHVGVDGVGVLFLPLTALLTLFVMLYAQPHRWEQPGAFVGEHSRRWRLALMGMFTALDLLQFWLFALAEVIPATLLIQRWGPVRRGIGRPAQYVRAMLGGLAGLLAGIVLLGWHHAAAAGPCGRSTCRRCWRRRFRPGNNR